MADVNKGPITAAFTAVDQVSDHVVKGLFGGDVSISGTFVATIALQRLLGGAWQEVKTYTAPDEDAIANGSEGVLYRLKCTAFTSGTANVVLRG